MKYGNIHLLAILLSALYRYHASFVVSIIDNVVESICFGLELNDFKFNQRRIAEVKYLGELYNYRMLEHPVIFDTMYKIMTFGHGTALLLHSCGTLTLTTRCCLGGPPTPGRLNPFDMPDDFFRIRLIATILETCGVFFNRGTAGKKLDYFLSFFQYYIYTKNPMPMDIEFIIQDIFALTRPQWKLATNLEEAAKAFQLAVAQDQKTSGADKAAEQDEGTSGPSSEDENGDDLAMGEQDGDDDSGSEEEEAEVCPEQETPQIMTITNRVRIGQDFEHQSSPRDSESEGEQIVVTREEEEIDPEDEAEFEREYAKIMAESLESRKFERKPLIDVPLPVRAKNRDAQAASEAGENGMVGMGGNTMAFSLLTKKGNRQQVCDRFSPEQPVVTNSRPDPNR